MQAIFKVAKSALRRDLPGRLLLLLLFLHCSQTIVLLVLELNRGLPTKLPPVGSMLRGDDDASSKLLRKVGDP